MEMYKKVGCDHYDLNNWLEVKPSAWFFLLSISSLPSQGEARANGVSKDLGGGTSPTSAQKLSLQY